MRNFNVGDRVTLPVGTIIRNTATGKPSVWNSPAALTQPLTGTLRTPPDDQRCTQFGEWFQFVADAGSGLAGERARFDRFLYPEADLEPVPPPDEWVSVGHALPPVHPSDVGLPCSESDWVLIAVPGWSEPAVAQFRRWVDEGTLENTDWVLWGRHSYIVEAPVTHWRKLPALPEPPPFTR